MKKDVFDKQMKGSLHNALWIDGYLVRKMVEIPTKRKYGWICKQCTDHGSVQYWSKKTDFCGDTAERAVQKAVQFIEQYRKERSELEKSLGINND